MTTLRQSDKHRFTVSHPHRYPWLGEMGYEASTGNLNEHDTNEAGHLVLEDGKRLWCAHLFVPVDQLDQVVLQVEDLIDADVTLTGGYYGGDSAHEWCEPLEPGAAETMLHVYFMVADNYEAAETYGRVLANWTGIRTVVVSDGIDSAEDQREIAMRPL